MELALLISSTICFVAVFAVSLHGLLRGERVAAWIRYGLMGLGFGLQSGFLYLRGQVHGRCPLTNGFEVLIFVSWAMVLLYFIIGGAFRLSLLGFFTAPLALLFQGLALVLSGILDKTTGERVAPDFWLELHAAVSLIAYGAFALACIAGIMFLVQDRQLKKGEMAELFYQLPPIHYLTHAITRLLWIAFALLSLGIGAAFMMERMPGVGKLTLIFLVWIVYGSLLGVILIRGLGARTLALASVVAFIFPVITYWFLRQPSSV